MGMAAGRPAAMAAAAVLLLLLAGGAHADCYGDCFNDCMGKFKNMRDYCSYACDKVCSPDAADAALQRPPLAAVVGVGPAAALADHHHPMDKKRDAHAAVWPAALPDHPFHETRGGSGAVEPLAGQPDLGHVIPPPRVPVLP